MKKIMIATVLAMLLPTSLFAAEVDMQQCVDTHLANKRERDAGLDTKEEVATRETRSTSGLRRNTSTEDVD